MIFKAYPYQSQIIDFMLSHTHCAVWAEMGLGKTVCALTAIKSLLGRRDVQKVLIVAPKRVAQHVWPAEIDKWTHTQGLTYTSLVGPLKTRLERMQEATQIHVVNYDVLPWLVERHTAKTWPYDCIVFDESSKLKSRATQRFKAAKTIAKVATHVFELTGTPSPNGLLDLWPQLYLLDRGERLEKGITAFRNRWFTENRWRHTWDPKPHAMQEIQDKVRDICISLKAKDYLDLPERVYNNVYVDLPTRAMSIYKELEEHFILELEGGVITATNAAVLTNKCIQAANGAIYDVDRNWIETHTAKLEALAEVRDEADGPLLVAYGYKSDLQRIQHEFPDAVDFKKDPTAVDKWNAGDIPMLLIHPASAGHGLNLQHGGHTIVWFSLPWSLELYQQANARLHRQGQDTGVIVHHLVAAKTLDEGVLQVLEGKASVQEALMSAVKRG